MIYFQFVFSTQWRIVRAHLLEKEKDISKIFFVWMIKIINMEYLWSIRLYFCSSSIFVAKTKSKIAIPGKQLQLLSSCLILLFQCFSFEDMDVKNILLIAFLLSLFLLLPPPPPSLYDNILFYRIKVHRWHTQILMARPWNFYPSGNYLSVYDNCNHQKFHGTTITKWRRGKEEVKSSSTRSHGTTFFSVSRI